MRRSRTGPATTPASGEAPASTVVRARVPARAGTGRGVPVHACASAIEQDSAIGTAPYGPVYGPPDGGWQRDQNDLGAFAAYAQHPVAVLFAKISDISAGGLEDPQAEKSEHRDEREVARRWRLAGSGQQCLKLQVGEPQGR
jgi:hypothetical protein